MSQHAQLRASAELSKEFNERRKAAGLMQSEAVDQALRLWTRQHDRKNRKK